MWCTGRGRSYAAEETTGVFVLFVGNSFTAYNGRLDLILKDLCMHGASKEPLHIDADVAVKMGEPLEKLVKSKFVLRAIKRAPARPGVRRVLVLQDDLALTTFGESQKAFDSFKKLNDRLAHPFELLVLGCWPCTRPESPTDDEATAHHRAMAARVNGRLADVIGAIKLHAERAPNVALFEDDGVHPLGVLSYLMACLVYAATFNCTRAVATALPWWDNGYQKPPGVKPFSKPSVPELEVAREVAWAASVAEASRAAWSGFTPDCAAQTV